jgi:MFS transporter, SP family, sugar:H+ symporter
MSSLSQSTPSSTNLSSSNLGSKVFFVWGGFCCVCMVFVYFCIYETKGLSLEQVDELYAKVSSAHQSKHFVPTVSYTEVQELGAGEARRSTLADLEQAAIRRKSSAGVHHEGVDEKY